MRFGYVIGLAACGKNWGEHFPLMEVAANWLERYLPALDRLSVVLGNFRSQGNRM
jgi:hypothetical protein